MRSDDFVVPLSPQEKTINDTLEPVLSHEGYELVSVKVAPSQYRSLVGLFIDTKEPGGITMAMLESLNRLIGPTLDVLDAEQRLFRGAYNLEVSSPGLERPLSRLRHFEAVVGKTVAVKTNQIGLPRKVIGKLISIENDGLKIEAADQTYLVPFDCVRGANLVFEFEKKSRSKK